MILRDVTERPEVVESGAGKIVGTDAGRIIQEASNLLVDRDAYLRMTSARNPFGDGLAAERIAQIVQQTLELAGSPTTN